MREIAPLLASWVGSGREAVVARVMEMDGFGGRRAGEVWARTADGESAGALMLGAADEALADAAGELLGSRRGAITLTVPVGDGEAVAAGLACGGVAQVLIQRASLVPSELWNAVAARVPVVMATMVEGPQAGSVAVIAADRMIAGSLGTTDADAASADAGREMLTGTKTGARLVASPLGRIFLEAVIPQPHLMVVGVAELARCLERLGAFLGWSVDVLDERADVGAAAAALGPVDGLVVLSHDIPVSCTALAAALGGRCGYVGALGSRHTQGARRQYLTGTLGLSQADVAPIHGPVGLDLGARTPEETSLAIFAEALAVRSDRAPASLRGGSGPING